MINVALCTLAEDINACSILAVIMLSLLIIIYVILVLQLIVIFIGHCCVAVLIERIIENHKLHLAFIRNIY